MFDDLSDKVIHQPSLDAIKFFSVLKAIKPKINVVPLHDNPFNLGKSNIAWLEATYAGAVTLAPDTPEWRKAGVTNYKDEADFKTKLGFLLSLTDRELDVLHSMSVDAILQGKLLLSETNKTRLEILGRLVNGSSGT
jgi:hypothetical protein